MLAPAIVRRWNDEKIVFTTRPGTNDDWFWMFAALSNPRRDAVIVVSNDFLRDPHYKMLHTRTFADWRERHQATYSFTKQAGERRFSLSVQFPPTYSHRMQHSVDERAWFFPIEGSSSHWLAAWRCDDDGSAAAAAAAATGAAAGDAAAGAAAGDAATAVPSL